MTWMRISATGTSTRGSHADTVCPLTVLSPGGVQPFASKASRRGGVSPVAGFTLIEVMVVMVIISIIVSSVLFSIDITGTQKTRTAISNIQLLMRGLANEAILEGEHYGLKYDRDQQRLTPVAERNSGWSVYSSPGEGRPNFRPVSWKGIAEAEIITLGVSIDERRKDTANFYSGQREEDRKRAAQGPLIEFSPTGLWEPSGEMRFFVSGRMYATIRWTAAGRVTFEPGNASDVP